MNTKILLNERPHGEPNLGNFKTVKEDIRTPNDGEVLLKTIYMSLDPYMRGRMNDAKSYAKPVEIGEVMEAGALSQVIESKSKLFKPGDFVEGRTGWQDNPTVDEKKLRLIDPEMAPLSTSVGVLGMPGTTAVVPGMPKTPTEVESGAISGSINLSFFSSTVGLSCQPVRPSTKSPGLNNFDLLSITWLKAPASITSPISTGFA